MPRLLPPGPLFPYANIVKTTPAQEADALQCTREQLTAVRNLVRELDLPADMLGIALSVYREQLGAIVDKEMRKKAMEREKQVRAVVKEREAEAVKRFGGGVAQAQTGGYLGGMPYSPIEDEVRAELALEDEI